MTVVFTGCSLVEGVGLHQEKSSDDLWVNIVHKSVPAFNDNALINLGLAGIGNDQIFQDTLTALTSIPCSYIVVSWTELGRTQINPGLEMFYTGQFWCHNNKLRDININPGITYSAKYLTNIRDRLLDLKHPHYDILQVLRYSKIITKLCQELNVKVFFVNNLLSWDQDYFEHIHHATRTPDDTTIYTQKLLNIDSRDDLEYFNIYDKIHQEYQELKFSYDNWLNLYQSFRTDFILDRGNDGIHPGIESNRDFGRFISTKIINMLYTT